MSSIIQVDNISSRTPNTTPVAVSSDINFDSGKVLKINNTTVLTSTQVHGKSMPTGTIVGHNDEQTLYSKTLAGFTLSNDITVNAAVDIDLPDNNASALSFDAPGKTGILEIVTTDNAEKVKMSGDLEIAGTVVTNDTIVNINNAAPSSAPTKDIGVEFKYYDPKTSTMRTGFFGSITSSSGVLNGHDYFTFLNNTTNTSDKITGTPGTLKVGSLVAEYEITNASRSFTVNSSGVANFAEITISGDLTVNGTTTNINSTNLVIEDKNIILADVTSPTNTTADGAGLTIKGATDKTFNWVNSTSAWTSSEDINLASGKSYEINGTVVLSSDEVLGAITRKTNTLAVDGTVSISTLFGSQVSGSYRFFDINDPRISGTIFIKHNGASEPDVRVDSNSGTVSITANTASRLNVYISSNVVTFQNKTASSIGLRVYREI